MNSNHQKNSNKLRGRFYLLKLILFWIRHIIKTKRTMKVGRHVRIACSVHKEANKHRDSKSTLKPVHSPSSNNLLKSFKQDKSKNWSSILYFISYFFWLIESMISEEIRNLRHRHAYLNVHYKYASTCTLHYIYVYIHMYI